MTILKEIFGSKEDFRHRSGSNSSGDHDMNNTAGGCGGGCIDNQGSGSGKHTNTDSKPLVDCKGLLAVPSGWVKLKKKLFIFFTVIIFE